MFGPMFAPDCSRPCRAGARRRVQAANRRERRPWQAVGLQPNWSEA